MNSVSNYDHIPRIKLENHGIVNGPLSRYSTLTGRQLDAIEKMVGGNYTRVLSEVVRFE
jgi:hypothetical protein